MKWISVKDQLPDSTRKVTIRIEDQLYMPTDDEDGYIDSTTFDIDRQQFGYLHEDIDGVKEWFPYIDSKITHWTEYTGPKIRMLLSALGLINPNKYLAFDVGEHASFFKYEPKIKIPNDPRLNSISGKALRLVKVEDE